MEYKDPPGWNEPPEDCKPRFDAEGDAVNCMECDDQTCEHWQEWNEVNK